jgi:hypothetical protein
VVEGAGEIDACTASHAAHLVEPLSNSG